MNTSYPLLHATFNTFLLIAPTFWYFHSVEEKSLLNVIKFAYPKCLDLLIILLLILPYIFIEIIIIKSDIVIWPTNLDWIKNWVLKILHTDLERGAIQSSLQNWSSFFGLIVFNKVVFGPFSEELFFRGLLQHMEVFNKLCQDFKKL